MPPKLVSSDLNGTLIQQHSMSDMIRRYCDAEKFKIAAEVFRRQTAGTASMEEAFAIAGPLTQGLTLRQALEYAQTEMRYIAGFKGFLESLQKAGISFVINSTGYSVTIHAIRARYGLHAIQGFIGNTLEFGLDAKPTAALREDELEQKVYAFMAVLGGSANPEYDRIQATGKVHLGITDEAAKARLLFDYAKTHLPEYTPAEMVHMGDTMGDSGGILGIAQAGGIGIAFNYNEALQQFLENEIAQDPALKERIHFVDRKGPDANLARVTRLILER